MPASMPARRIELRLYSRPGCHLCDDMKLVVDGLLHEYDLGLEVVDITGDPQLESVYGQQIPVLEIGGRKAFKYRLTERDLRRRLNAEARRQGA